MEGTVETPIDTPSAEAKGSPEAKGRPSRKGAASGRKSSTAVNTDAGSDSLAAPRPRAQITLQSLLEAGAHFGHQTSRWNPAMGPFIYTARNGIHIINLPRTVQSWEVARKAIEGIVGSGGSVLFVGTKKQAQDPVVEEARRCGAYYVSRRWLGGMLTNFQTVRKSVDRMNKLDTILAEEDTLISTGQPPKFTKKERLMMTREREKLEFSLGGIKDMTAAPQLLFVIDIRREDISIKEAHRLDIPVVALVDTNCDPRIVTYPIPSNDDGTRAIRLFCAAVADAVLDGKKIADERRAIDPNFGRKTSNPPRIKRAASPQATEFVDTLASETAVADSAVSSVASLAAAEPVSAKSGAQPELAGDPAQPAVVDVTEK